MLVQFSVSNFRSIFATQTLSLVASAAKELSETHTFDPKISGLGRLVHSAAVYGPNAGGKSNLLLALQFLQGLVVNSATTFQQGTPIPCDPFKFSAKGRNSPSVFDVTFIQDKVMYEYSVSVDRTQVHDERLIAYPFGRPQRLFERTFEKRTKSYNWKFSSHLKGNRNVWRDATRSNALFLSTAVQFNSTQLATVFEWFQKRLVVIAGISQLNIGLTVKLLSQPGGKNSLLPFLRAADLGISDVELKREPIVPGLTVGGAPMVIADPGQQPVFARVTMFHQAAGKEKVGLDMSQESSGTQALFRGAGAWLNVLGNGEVLLFDEIDTSLHPLLTRFLVGLFNSKSSNKSDAQLLFTTHDISLLEDEVFRRDQVWFVEKNSQGETAVVPLTDFSPRKGEAIDRGYLRGRYGALPIVGNLSL